jgi:hypothetical protein
MRADDALNGVSLLDRPTFIVSCPRSGSHLLFELLAQTPDLWTIGGESHRTFAAIPELHPRRGGYDSGRLDASAATPRIALMLAAGWLVEARDRSGVRFAGTAANSPSIRLLEKTPANCLRVPFLRACFPDARFIFLHRDPRTTIASLIDAWTEGQRTGRFVTYRELPAVGDEPRRWCFFLPPGWRTVADRSLAEIGAHQWRAANAQILDDLDTLPSECWRSIAYERLLASPVEEIERLCAFIGVATDTRSRAAAAGPLALSATTLTAPAAEKWRRHEQDVLDVIASVEEVQFRVGRLRDRDG